MDRIILIAQQLVKEGKAPNTSLIKARLPKNTPLPSIIQGLKMWQENPNKKIDAPTEPALTGASIERATGSIDELIESRITELVAPLKKEVDELKKQIEALQSKVIKTNTVED